MEIMSKTKDEALASDAESAEAKASDQAESAEETAAADVPQDEAASDDTNDKEAGKKAKKAEEKPQVPDPDPAELALQVEATLMVTDKPLTAAKISDAVGGVRSKLIQDSIVSLNQVYEESGRSFRVEQVAGGYQILTQPQFSHVVEALTRKSRESKLTPAQLETLAIIAYKQPILRAEVETIRGVACGETIRVLMDRHLVKIVGRADEIGRPMLYGTTKAFLQTFGLNTIKDLPKAEELKPRT